MSSNVRCRFVYPVNLSGSRDEISGEKGSECGDIFEVGCGGVGDNDEVIFDDGTCQALAFLTSGAHLMHPDSDTV